MFVIRVVDKVGPSTDDWFSAVTLLDSLSIKTPDGLCPDELPCICSAIVKIVKKMDSAKMRQGPFGDRGSLASTSAAITAAALPLVQCLQTMGCDPVRFDRRDFHMWEQRVLKRMGWRINLPSHMSWLSAYCARLSALAPSIWRPSIEWARTQSTTVASGLVIWEATAARLPPRHLVVGVLGINMARAGMLPFHALRPAGVAAEEWGRLLADAGLEGPRAHGVLYAGHAQRMMQALQEAVMCSLEALRESCHVVLCSILFGK